MSSRLQHRAAHPRNPRGLTKAGDDPLDLAFGALSDPTRRAILARLAGGECSVTTLAKPFSLSGPAVSKHLRVLETASLIERRKVGRVHFCRLRVDALKAAGEWIQQQHAFWEQQLDALAAYLETER